MPKFKVGNYVCYISRCGCRGCQKTRIISKIGPDGRIILDDASVYDPDLWMHAIPRLDELVQEIQEEIGETHGT